MGTKLGREVCWDGSQHIFSREVAVNLEPRDAEANGGHLHGTAVKLHSWKLRYGRTKHQQPVGFMFRRLSQRQQNHRHSRIH